MSTKELILQNALELFAAADYAAVSMQEIAESVNIKKASLYFHFESKEELLRAVLLGAQRKWLAYINELTTRAGAQKSLVGALFSFMSGYIEYTRDKAVLQFWTRMYILPPPVLGENDKKDMMHIDGAVFEALLKVYKKFSKNGTEPIVMTLLRLLGGYISMGTEDGLNSDLPWKKELLLEIKVVLRGFMPRGSRRPKGSEPGRSIV